MKNITIKVLYCPTNGKMEFRNITPKLESYDEMIKCDCIDMVQFDDGGLFLIIDDEGRLTNKKVNRSFYEFIASTMGLGICGDYLLVRVNDEGETVSLTNRDVKELSELIRLQNNPLYQIVVEAMIDKENRFIKENPWVLRPTITPLKFE